MPIKPHFYIHSIFITPWFWPRTLLKMREWLGQLSVIGRLKRGSCLQSMPCHINFIFSRRTSLEPSGQVGQNFKMRLGWRKCSLAGVNTVGHESSHKNDIFFEILSFRPFGNDKILRIRKLELVDESSFLLAFLIEDYKSEIMTLIFVLLSRCFVMIFEAGWPEQFIFLTNFL